MNFFFSFVFEFLSTRIYASVDIALKFDSIDVPRTMSRVLRRQMMVVKENADVDMDVHLDKFFLSFSALFASNFFFFFFFTSRSRQVLFFSLHMLVLFERFFYAQSHLRSNKMTNISLRTTQTRTHTHTHIYIHDRSLCGSCTFFFNVNKKLFFCCFSLSPSRALSPFFFTFVRVREHTYMYNQTYLPKSKSEGKRQREKKKYTYEKRTTTCGFSISTWDRMRKRERERKRK